MRQGNIWVVAALILVGILAGIISSSQTDKHSALQDERVEFELSDLDGDKISLKKLLSENKLVILNFWATWCPPCRGEIPDLMRFASDYAERGVKLVGISDESAAIVREFAKQQSINYQILIDEQRAVESMYSIEAIPATFILDDQGQTLYQTVGSIDYDTLVSKVESFLK